MSIGVENLLLIETPELHTIKASGGLHMNLLGHQPILVIDHREHMVVLILVFQFQGPFGLELFLDTLDQFFERCVCPDEDCACVDVVAFHAELFKK